MIPSLSELKTKWFVDVEMPDSFPPQQRHPGSKIKPSTDGNQVELLVEGATVMADFHHRVEEMLAADDPSRGFILVAAMGIDPVKSLGENDPAPDAKSLMLQAAEAGVQVYFLASGQGGLGAKSKKFAEQLITQGGHGAIDKRFPGLVGGHHQKFNVTRGVDGLWTGLVSSADFFFARWDTADHLPENPARSSKGGPTHDAGLKVTGPAVADIALTFAERWNDPSSAAHTEPPISEPISTDFLDQAMPAGGSHSVQVLRTFPLIQGKKGYSWSGTGEYTIWAAYLNAIKQAQEYVYIEDQYLYTFHDPPYIETSHGVKRDTDLVYQLGEALKRGVDVIAVVPGRNNVPWKHYEIQQRRRAAQYLHGIAESDPKHGNIVICLPHVGGKDITVHSKLMLVDDEYALVGSANICERSIAYISELQLGVVDAENKLVRDMRLALWQEHLELDSPETVLDPREGAAAFHQIALLAKGRLRLVPHTRMRPEFPYRFLMNKIIDPYSGPERAT
jgi:phosphatidylserine/phosphatidylglycerophosphate/cardiolipin synthase-like enzyme